MGTIETTYDLPNDLTVAKATGKMTSDDFKEWAEEYYVGDKITSLHLWDVTEADLSEITIEEIKEDAKRTKLLAGVRNGGKTAIVTHKDLEFGISRMSQAHHEIEVESVEYHTFRSIDEAKEWLGV